jgi:hypothetical protein
MYVYGHMDKYLPWKRLTLIQQMNCVCNTLTKAALTNAIINGYHQQPTQFLPKEDAALVVWGEKKTGDISHTILLHASKEVARRNHKCNLYSHGHPSTSMRSNGNGFGTANQIRHVQDVALETNLRFLWSTCASGEIHQSRLSRQVLPQLCLARNTSAPHAMP